MRPSQGLLFLDTEPLVFLRPSRDLGASGLSSIERVSKNPIFGRSGFLKSVKDCFFVFFETLSRLRYFLIPNHWFFGDPLDAWELQGLQTPKRSECTREL